MKYKEKKEKEILENCQKEAALYVVEIDKIIDSIEPEEKRNKELKTEFHNEKFEYLLNQQRLLHNLTHGNFKQVNQKTNKSKLTIKVNIDLMSTGVGESLGKSYIKDIISRAIKEHLQSYCIINSETIEHFKSALISNYYFENPMLSKINNKSKKNFTPVISAVQQIFDTKLEFCSSVERPVLKEGEAPYVEILLMDRNTTIEFFSEDYNGSYTNNLNKKEEGEKLE